MIPTLLMKGLTAFFTKAIMAFAGEKMVAYTFFSVAEAVARSTSTPHDDEWLKRMKAAYEEQK